MKILSINDLNSLKKRAQQALELREDTFGDQSECCGLATGANHLQLLVCGGTGCKASYSHKIVDNLKAVIKDNGIADKVEVITTGCFGFCEKGPIVKVMPDNTFYTQVKPDDATEIIKEHIIGGRRVERLLYLDPKTQQHVSDSKHMDFYRKQMRIALRNCGLIDPENIEEYIARDGYQGIANALLNQTPEEVIEIIKASGLRGRGGAGFPTGMKWGFARGYEADEKYVVCNADEGDPNDKIYPVTQIGPKAFQNSTGLTSVTFPTGIISIEEYAFNGCNNASFTSIVLPTNVTSIGNYAFQNCTNLASINIPSNVNNIGK